MVCGQELKFHGFVYYIFNSRGLPLLLKTLISMQPNVSEDKGEDVRPAEVVIESNLGTALVF